MAKEKRRPRASALRLVTNTRMAFLASWRFDLQEMVPKGGVEPPHPCGYMVLNHARLPFRHFGTANSVYQTGRPLSTRIRPWSDPFE